MGGDDFQTILAVTGPLFQGAVALEASAVLADTAGNQHGGQRDEHPPRSPISSLLHAAASLITPAVLMIYAWFAFNGHVFASASEDFRTRVGAVALIVVAMIVGSIIGWGVGRSLPARWFRVASTPLALAACALALYVGWPTIADMIEALREGRALVVVPVIAPPPAATP